MTGVSLLFHLLLVGVYTTVTALLSEMCNTYGNTYGNTYAIYTRACVTLP